MTDDQRRKLLRPPGDTDESQQDRSRGACQRPAFVDSSQTSEIGSRVLSRFYEFVFHIRGRDKKSYSEARQRAPDIVDTESDPVRFLRCENFDSSKAAHRLLNYWTKRKDIFGDDAFRPMSRTGRGALSPKDAEILSGGFVFLLEVDKPKRHFPFIFYDSVRLRAESVEAQLRCFFYTMTIAAQDQESQHGGVQFVLKIDMTCLQHIQACGDLIKKALPIRIRAVHVLYSFNAKENNDGFLEKPNQVPQVLHDVFPEGANIYVHKDQKSLHSSLLLEGVSLNDLPTSLGWAQDSTELRSRREARIKQEATLSERKLPPHNPKRPRSGESDVSETKHSEVQLAKSRKVKRVREYEIHPSLSIASLHAAEGLHSGEGDSPGNINSLPEERKQDFIRKRNALYSRRMYHKRKIELTGLEEQTADLESRKELLTQENRRLTRLLSDARVIVAKHEAALRQSPQERRHAAPSSLSQLNDDAGQSYPSSLASITTNQVHAHSFGQDRYVGLSPDILRPAYLGFQRNFPWSQRVELNLSPSTNNRVQNLWMPRPTHPFRRLDAALLQEQRLAHARNMHLLNGIKSASRLPSDAFQLGTTRPMKERQSVASSSSSTSSGDDSASLILSMDVLTTELEDEEKLPAR